MRTIAKTTMSAHGFSLIEVLVALFVLAVGVTGVITMQLTALRTAQQTELRTRALTLASEMADNMRNAGLQMQYADADNPYLYVNDDGASTASSLAANCYLPDRPCDGDQLAQFYIAEWLSRLHAALPGGRARICRDDALRDRANDQIDWPCSASMSTAPLIVKIAWQNKSEAKHDPDEIDASLSVIGLVVASRPR